MLQVVQAFDRVPTQIVVVLVALQAQIGQDIGAQRIVDAVDLYVHACMHRGGDPQKQAQRGNPRGEFNRALVVVHYLCGKGSTRRPRRGARRNAARCLI